MITMLWIALLLLGAVLPGSLADGDGFGLLSEVELSLTISMSHANEGDNVTLECRAENMVSNSDALYWAKEVWYEGDKSKVEIIATNDLKIPPFTSLSNYQITIARSGNTVSSKMNLYGVTAQETGDYICSYLEMDNNVLETEKLEVYAPVTYINTYVAFNDSTHEQLDGNIISANQSDLIYLGFEAGDSIPAARLTVFLGETDVTSNFTSVKHMTDGRCTESSEGKNCPVHYTQRAFIESHIFEVNPVMRDLDLVVSAYVPGSDFAVFNHTLNFEVNYLPQFKCLTEWYVRAGDMFTLGCKVRAYPWADTLYWSIPGEGDEDEPLMLDAMDSEKYGNYTAGAEKLSEDEGHEENTYLVTLDISYVGPESFKDYTLFAGNYFGNNTLVFTVIEDTTPQDGNGAPYFSASSLLLCIIVGIFHVFVC